MKILAIPADGIGPDIAGQNIANPVSMILSAAMLLQWGGDKYHRPELVTAANAIETAVDRVLLDDSLRTPDLGGRGNTDKFAQAVATDITQ